MASSSNSKATCSQRVNAYLNGLQEEFELQSNPSTNTRRFNIFLGNLKGEFDLMSLEIESLRKDRDEYKAKVKNIHHTVICERCNPNAPQIVSSPSRKTSLSSSRFWQFKSRAQPVMSVASSRDVDPNQTRRSTHMTLIQRLHSAITPPRLSQSTSRFIDTMITPTIAPLPSPQRPASIVDAGSGHEDHDWSITFNNEAEKDLDVELTHTLFHEESIPYVKFSQDGKNLAAGCLDGKTYIYDAEAGTLTCVLRNLLADREGITVVCFARDGKYLATGTRDGDIYVWEIKEKFVRNTFNGHTDCIWCLDFSPNGRLLVSASHTVRLWNMRDGSGKSLIGGNSTMLDYSHYRSAVFSPDGKYVAAGDRDGMVKMWDVRTGRLVRRLNMQDYPEYWQWTDVKFMPDGMGLVSVSRGRTFQCWDISTLGATRTTDVFDGHVSGVEEQTKPERTFLGHKDMVYSIAVSPDGRWVASGSSDQSVRIWDTRNAVTQCILDNVHDWVCSVDISPSGCYLASGGRDGMVRIWRYSYMAPRRS